MEQKQGFWDASPKAMFAMGLFLGIAVASTVGLGLAIGGVWRGNVAAGSQVAAANNPAQKNPSPTDDQQQPPAKPVKAVAANDHVRGPKDAKVTLIEYSDFQCPFCKRFSPTLEQAMKDFPKDVRFVYRHFPLSSIHPFAEKAAEASECAAKLGGDGAFWKMHDKMIPTDDLGVDSLKKMAKDIGLDQAKFNACLDGGEMAARVNQDFAEGGDAGVQGTPATFINGTLVSGAIPYAGANGFKEALQKAGAKN